MREALAYGVIGAAFAGTLMGAAMKPASGSFEREVHGPRLLSYDERTRDLTGGGQAGLAAYGGAIPDYVLGSDWTEPVAYDLDAEIYYAELYGQAAMEPVPEPVSAPVPVEPREYATPKIRVSYPPQISAPQPAPKGAPRDAGHVAPTRLVEGPPPVSEALPSGSG